ncbi:MAG: flagellar basal body L-ring protein FlgH [Myxococcota bacterium]
MTPLVAGAALLFSTGCIETGIQEALKPFDYEAMDVPQGRPPEPGSIWLGDAPSGSFLFFDQKARGAGDLVTVRVLERMSAAGQATTDLSKGSSLGASVNSDVGFQEFVTGPIKWLFRVLGISNPGNDVTPGVATNVVQSQLGDDFAGDGSTQRSGSFTATVTCRVVSVLPGRIFHVRGRRAIAVNKEMQYLSVEGLVRQQDIGIDNTVGSDVLAEARITLDGLGVIDDKQRPGWMTRVLSWLYPF